MNKTFNTDDIEPEKTCFVISPIGEPDSEVRARADKVFKFIIAPAAREAGLIAIRSDHIATPGMITQQVIRHIITDKMVVADLSDHNANVFYELALRHAFRKPVVQLIVADQKIPFDIQGARTVNYRLTLEDVESARELVTKQIGAALSAGVEVESPVTIAARIEDLKSSSPQTEALMNTVLARVDNVSQLLSDMNKTLTDAKGTLWSTEGLKETIPAYVRDKMEDILRRYAEEIDLLQSVRQAGIIGVYKRREAAIRAFSRHIDAEQREIAVIGSSLKGLLQKEEYKDIADKLKFKMGLIRVRFLLTHPIVADFRASQENRRPTEIGLEIISSLETLKKWDVDCSNVRLYLGTPTCFAIKTTGQMLINPYPYISVSYDSPCFLLESSVGGGVARSGYFFDEFDSRHFGAWDTDLAVHIKNYDETIRHCKEYLSEYAQMVEKLLASGKVLGK